MQATQKEYIISSDRSVSLGLKELWSYRELFYYFTWRDVKVKYKQTALGVIWVVIQPVLAVVIFSYFFGRTLKVPTGGLDYPVFVFSGLLFWNFFSTSVNGAGNSMLTNAGIIKKIYFPRIIIPVSALMVNGVDFIIAFIVFLLVLVSYGTPVNLLYLIIFWPLGLVVLIVGTLGISCWLAALVVKYRDFRYVIPFTLQIALFVSPVIYPVSVKSMPVLNYLLAVNPMYAAINLFRMPLMAQDTDITLMGISLFSSVAFMVFGILYFKKTESFFADLA